MTCTKAYFVTPLHILAKSAVRNRDGAKNSPISDTQFISANLNGLAEKTSGAV